MQTSWRGLLAAALITALGGCGGDDDGGEPSATALLEQWVIEYDRGMAAQCQCLVTLGAYVSVDECLGFLGSGPGWAECSARVLEEGGYAWTPEEARCHIEAAAAKATCLERAGCDADANLACANESIPTCPEGNQDFFYAVFEACPDFALLSRTPEG